MPQMDPMTEDRPRPVPNLPNPGRLEERPRWVMPVLLAWIGLVLAGYLAMTYAWGTTEPAPTPTYEPDECTAEYVEENGICLTWDDIREQPTYTQAP